MGMNRRLNFMITIQSFICLHAHIYLHNWLSGRNSATCITNLLQNMYISWASEGFSSWPWCAKQFPHSPASLTPRLRLWGFLPADSGMPVTFLWPVSRWPGGAPAAYIQYSLSSSLPVLSAAVPRSYCTCCKAVPTSPEQSGSENQDDMTIHNNQFNEKIHVLHPFPNFSQAERIWKSRWHDDTQQLV